LTRPVSESYSSRQITPTTTGATVIGRISETRTKRMPRTSRTTSRARPRPRRVSIATAIPTNLAVVPIACQNVWSWRTLR
jgi:hypothetical protein